MPVFYLSISLLLYVLALFFDGALMSGERHMPALQMLLYGPWGMPFGLFQWFANPLLALAILAHRRFRRLALLAGLATVYLAASSFGIDRLPDNQSYAFHERTMPGWNWLDVALIAALAVTLYAATQMPSLRFEPGNVLMPPEQPQTL